MGTTSRRRRRSRAEWQSLVSRAAASPLGTAAFCAAEGISAASLSLWRKRLQACDAAPMVAAPTPGAFVDLGLLAAPGERGCPWELELDLGGGVTLRLRRR